MESLILDEHTNSVVTQQRKDKKEQIERDVRMDVAEPVEVNAPTMDSSKTGYGNVSSKRCCSYKGARLNYHMIKQKLVALKD